MKIKNIGWLLLILLGFFNCSTTVSKENQTTTEGDSDNISIARFDKDFYSYLKNPSIDNEKLLKNKYPALLSAVGMTTIGFSIAGDSANFFPTLNTYFGHTALLDIYNEASFHVFNDVTLYEDQLSKANELIKEYMPNRKLSPLAMHVSGFKENVLVLNGMISISADKYLGADNAAYANYFNDYQRLQMSPQYVVRDYLKAWLMTTIRPEGEYDNLLSEMVYEGKVLYILALLLPQSEDTDLIGYTSDQLAWCQTNEKNVWQTVMKQNHLYTTDYATLSKYIDAAPYTAFYAQQSPGQLGRWIGWKVVNQYIKKKNPTIDDLIALDAQTILKESKYNP